jgi:hypothetical protein
VYKAAQGKREPTGAAFVQDVIDLFLAEKALKCERSRLFET